MSDNGEGCVSGQDNQCNALPSYGNLSKVKNNPNAPLIIVFGGQNDFVGTSRAKDETPHDMNADYPALPADWKPAVRSGMYMWNHFNGPLLNLYHVFVTLDATATITWKGVPYKDKYDDGFSRNAVTICGEAIAQVPLHAYKILYVFSLGWRRGLDVLNSSQYPPTAFEKIYLVDVYLTANRVANKYPKFYEDLVKADGTKYRYFHTGDKKKAGGSGHVDLQNRIANMAEHTEKTGEHHACNRLAVDSLIRCFDPNKGQFKPDDPGRQDSDFLQ